MDASASQAAAWIHNAAILQEKKKYAEAEECYTHAITSLRSAIMRPGLLESEKHTLRVYMSDIARSIQRLRTARKATTPHDSNSRVASVTGEVMIRQQSTAVKQLHGVSDTKAGGGIDDDYLSFLTAKDDRKTSGVPRLATDTAISKAMAEHTPIAPALPLGAKSKVTGKIPETTPARSPMAGNTASGKDGGGKRISTTDGGNNNSGSLPPARTPASASASVNRDRLGNHFAPRASAAVLRAIEVATQLYRANELKRALDVLMHAYDTGKRERHNPSNFSAIEETLVAMRKRYYEQFPPRFVQDNPVLPEEMEVLRKSGITKTIVLPIWDDVHEGYGAENVYMPSADVWTDEFTPELSVRQQKQGALLVHACEFISSHQVCIIDRLDPLAIVQGAVTDCSLVCTLIICANYQQRFPNARIIDRAIYPQDNEGKPIVNPKGKYCMKMLINGITRLVTIDDRIPVNLKKRTVLCTGALGYYELWPMLVEKAFVKVCGGSYAYPGSNSCYDLYKLSAWLPEYVEMKLDAESFDPDYHWKRLHRAFTSGAAVMTVSTSKDLSPSLEEKLLLPSKHCFAVLNLLEMPDGTRLVQIRNPWSSRTWTGKYSLNDQDTATKELHATLQFSEELANKGVAWMSWDDVTQYFSTVCLSWNPYMLFSGEGGRPRPPVRLACHMQYDYSTQVQQTAQLHIGVVQAKKASRMHLVFARHHKDLSGFVNYEHPPSTFVAVYDVTGYPSLAYHLGGRCAFGMCYCRRLSSSGDFSKRLRPLCNIHYRSCTESTTSFDVPAGTSDLLVMLTCKEHGDEPFSFTVTIHTDLTAIRLPDLVYKTSSNGATLPSLSHGHDGPGGVFMHAIPKTALQHSTTIPGEWKRGVSCGGATRSSAYVYNPQYLLKLSQPSYFSVRLLRDGERTSSTVIVAKKSHPLPGTGNIGAPRDRIAFYRIGNPNRESDLVLMPREYTFGGTLLDSAMPHILINDFKRILGDGQKRTCKRYLMKKVNVAVVDGPAGMKSTVLLQDVEDHDELSHVLLAVVAEGHLVSPSAPPVVILGEGRYSSPLKWTDTMQRVFDTYSDATKVVNEDEIWLFIHMNVENTINRSQLSGKSQEIWSLLKQVASDIIKYNSQRSKAVPTLLNVIRSTNRCGNDPGAADQLMPQMKTYFISMSTFMTSHLESDAKVRPSRPEPVDLVPPLPAGEYTIIPSMWKRGKPGRYELTVETTEPHTLVPIPAEGDGMQEKWLSGKLCAEGTPLLRGTAWPPALVRRDDPFFLNNRASIQLSSRAVFSARFVTVVSPELGRKKAKGEAASCRNIDSSSDDSDDAAGDGGAGVESGKVPPAHLGLFRIKDHVMMEMIASSGNYTVGGVAIHPVMLDAGIQYLLVLSTQQPSTLWLLVDGTVWCKHLAIAGDGATKGKNRQRQANGTFPDGPSGPLDLHGRRCDGLHLSAGCSPTEPRVLFHVEGEELKSSISGIRGAAAMGGGGLCEPVVNATALPTGTSSCVSLPAVPPAQSFDELGDRSVQAGLTIETATGSVGRGARCSADGVKPSHEGGDGGNAASSLPLASTLTTENELNNIRCENVGYTLNDTLAQHQKHVFIFTSCGKPLFTRYGNMHAASDLFAMLLVWMHAADSTSSCTTSPAEVVQEVLFGEELCFYFHVTGELRYVMATRSQEGAASCVAQLRQIHGCVQSFIPTINTILLKSPGLDLCRLFSSTDAAMLRSFIKWQAHSLSFCFQALEAAPLSLRRRSWLETLLRRHYRTPMVDTCSVTSTHVQQSSSKQVNTHHLCSYLLFRGRVVAAVAGDAFAPQSTLPITADHPSTGEYSTARTDGGLSGVLHTDDLLLVIHYAQCITRRQAGEAWAPLCLPHFNDSGYLWCYCSSLSYLSRMAWRCKSDEPTSVNSAGNDLAGDCMPTEEGVASSGMQSFAGDRGLLLVQIASTETCFSNLADNAAAILNAVNDGGIIHELEAELARCEHLPISCFLRDVPLVGKAASDRKCGMLPFQCVPSMPMASAVQRHQHRWRSLLSSAVQKAYGASAHQYAIDESSKAQDEKVCMDPLSIPELRDVLPLQWFALITTSSSTLQPCAASPTQAYFQHMSCIISSRPTPSMQSDPSEKKRLYRLIRRHRHEMDRLVSSSSLPMLIAEWSDMSLVLLRVTSSVLMHLSNYLASAGCPRNDTLVDDSSAATSALRERELLQHSSARVREVAAIFLPGTSKPVMLSWVALLLQQVMEQDEDLTVRQLIVS